jgi:UDP-N-acetylmuramyl pentapeptide phosphotransferase/UDP-N-acetylglucosamine-1-phosphate transferase
MESYWGWAVLPLAVLAGTVWLTGPLLGWLQRRAILDRPVERSSHTVPVPRGGGLVLIPLVLIAWLIFAAAGNAPHGTTVITIVAGCLALLSWFDDLGGLGVGWRLAVHLVAAALGVLFLPGTGLVFQGALPPLLDHAVTVLLWVWFLNLYNFMDGIDGITGAETIAIGLGIVLVLSFAGLNTDDASLLALVLAAGALGFLRWNWAPARIFLGDVGSVPLGFITGWLLLAMAARGLWASALILPLYYLADSGWTLMRRILRGERFWEAHRTHFYQRALAPDGEHRLVVRLIAAGNISLVALAGLAIYLPRPALIIAILITAYLLRQLSRRAKAPPSSAARGTL